MSDVFTNLCLFGKEKKKNSVSNQITVVGVKKALLIGMYLKWVEINVSEKLRSLFLCLSWTWAGLGLTNHYFFRPSVQQRGGSFISSEEGE